MEAGDINQPFTSKLDIHTDVVSLGGTPPPRRLPSSPPLHSAMAGSQWSSRVRDQPPTPDTHLSMLGVKR